MKSFKEFFKKSNLPQSTYYHGSDDHISLVSLRLNNAKNEGYDGAVLHNSLRPDMHHEVVCFNPHKTAKVHKKIER